MKKWLFFLIMTMLFSLTSSALGAQSPNLNNMIYLYGGNSNTYKQQLELTNAQVGTLAPGYFGITTDGNLTSTVDKEFVRYAQEKGYRITPFITNDWNQALGIKAMNNWQNLADDLVHAAVQYNLDGINIDIENLTPNQRDLQTKFLTRLSSKLKPLDKTVSIAVAPARFDSNKGWVGSYDFEAIGKIVDTVFIMAYDQSYPMGPEGPVAGLPWVEESIQYLIKIIPKDKLVLGVPFYGRYWTETDKGKGIYFSKSMKLINQNKASIDFDPVNFTNVSRFRDQASGKNYVIWFDSAETILERIKLVEKYGLKGWGAWHLGQEDTNVWSALQDNPLPFRDITNHWAKKDILLMSEHKLMKGYMDRTFRPQNQISREEVASLLTTTLKLDTSKTDASYKDLSQTRWSFPFVSTISTYGLMKGYPDNTFRPNQSITRAEFASSLVRSFKLPEQSHSSIEFLDVKDHWASDDIRVIQQAGIITGYSDGSFRPNQTVTRAEAAVMLSRIIR